MESESGKDTMLSLQTVEGLLPLASVSQQPYVSELLSFTLDRLHKVHMRAYLLALFELLVN